MATPSYNSSQRWVSGILLSLTVLVVCLVGAWRLAVTRPTLQVPARRAASAEIVAAFYKSLAALDVDESELAGRVLQQAVQQAPEEPALWANLAVAQLRLRDMQQARGTLQRAMELAGDSQELAVLRADVLEHSGEIEAAIKQFRTIQEKWPDNVSATYSLVTLLGQLRSKEADAERLSLLADILRRLPGNWRALCEQARLAATLEQGDVLRAALDQLAQPAAAWPDAVRKYYVAADRAARANEFQDAARSLTFMENVLKPNPEYQRRQAELGVSAAAAIGTPVRRFLRLELPSVESAEADFTLTFELQDSSVLQDRSGLPGHPALPEDSPDAPTPVLVQILEPSGSGRPTLVSLSEKTLYAGTSTPLPFPGSSSDLGQSCLVAADLNFDFVQDLVGVGPEGCRIYLAGEDGAFTVVASELEEFTRPWRSVWAVDVEADGDLDLLLSDHESPLVCVQNNGGMTFSPVADVISAAGVCDLDFADFDGDGDVDLCLLNRSGHVRVWRNERGGRYVPSSTLWSERQVQISTGDVDRDGRMDVVAVAASGRLRCASRTANGTWSNRLLAEGPPNWPPNVSPGEASLAAPDIDNNGAIDLVAGCRSTAAVWLQTADADWSRLAIELPFHVGSIADVNDDGLLDLVGVNEEGARIAINRSGAGYGWHRLQTLANTAAGDKRINPFGVGGRIEVRAGNLVQAMTIRSPRSQVGLGHQKVVDVARIVWPNGTVQAEFDLRSGEPLVARQRLKGSCPWVFAFDGQGFSFIKDFIWRSPLGLRINGQHTAGVVQTEDWIKIPGERLAVRDGRYLLRITAELWETHFFDHVSLLAVDHPPDVEVLVDERFVPTVSPQPHVAILSPPQPLHKVVDHRGKPVTEVLKHADGRYVDGFALGEFQGVASEHWVEFELPALVDAGRRIGIVGNGWIYPTDSSLNIALSQGAAQQPFGLILEQRSADGVWRVVQDHLGFPAGKNKNVIIALPPDALARSRHFRLRTNMEVYWDSLGWSYLLDHVEPQIAELSLRVAELRYRGYSRLLPVDRRRPDTPVYEIVGTESRWLDLEGYYTRFGDVRGLLRSIDDRYVIMNAGDELAFEFDAGGAVPPGWQRDFVLVGDGWVKDGDFNTAFSQWVQPLPTHADGDYAGPLKRLESDPVYRQHPEDWQTFHTRYVRPARFQRGLWPPVPQHAQGEHHE